MHVLTMTIAYLLTINCIWLTDIIQWNLSTQGKITNTDRILKSPYLYKDNPMKTEESAESLHLITGISRVQ